MGQWNPIIVGLTQGTDTPTDMNTSMRMNTPPGTRMNPGTRTTPRTNPGMRTTMNTGSATATPTA